MLCWGTTFYDVTFLLGLLRHFIPRNDDIYVLRNNMKHCHPCENRDLRKA